MFIYNSLSGKKEKLVKPRAGKPLRLFVCGPTVYDSPHLGHMRTAVAFDIIVRFLRSRGFDIVYLQNITNVDDKIIARARGLKKNPFAFASHFEKEYYGAMRAFHVDSVDIYARASNFIPHIISQIKKLIRKGYAYEIPDDGYYFDISKFADYGKLSRRTALQAEDSISRIDEGVKKRNKGDFCLWKFTDIANNTNKRRITRIKYPYRLRIINSEPAWETELGFGRPGWHIEDTAITESFFGVQYDLHGGGIDLKFPHHEAEIAQQEAASEKKPFVRFWMHVGSLVLNGKKMSKSLKNFISTDKFLKNYGSNDEEAANMFRMIALNHHYRSPVDFTNALADSSLSSYRNISEFLLKLEFLRKRAGIGEKKKKIFSKREIACAEKEFIKKMEDDFNTLEAMGVIFKIINKIQARVWELPRSEAASLSNLLFQLLQVFGFTFEKARIPKEIRGFVKKRELYRRNKQFMQADALRKRIQGLGYEVEDTPIGPFIKKFVR